jgi:hypothetical protein
MFTFPTLSPDFVLKTCVYASEVHLCTLSKDSVLTSGGLVISNQNGKVIMNKR